MNLFVDLENFSLLAVIIGEIRKTIIIFVELILLFTINLIIIYNFLLIYTV